MKSVSFFGSLDSVTKWKALVEDLVGRVGTPVMCLRPYTNTFIIDLTVADLNLLQEKLWYAESGMGTDALGRPWKWNCCITFKENKKAKNR